jgi:hypothetical protein
MQFDRYIGQTRIKFFDRILTSNPINKISNVWSGVGCVSLGTAAWVQLDRYNLEDSKTGRVGIPGCPVL